MLAYVKEQREEVCPHIQHVLMFIIMVSNWMVMVRNRVEHSM